MVRYFNWDISFSHFPWPIIFHIFDRGEQSSLNQNSMSWRTTHWTMRTLPPTVLCRSEQHMLEAKTMSYTFYFFWINSSNFSGEFSKFLKIRALLNTLNIPFSFLNTSTHNTLKCFKIRLPWREWILVFPVFIWPYHVPLCTSYHFCNGPHQLLQLPSYFLVALQTHFLPYWPYADSTPTPDTDGMDGDISCVAHWVLYLE